LQAIQPSQRTTSIKEALRLAAGLANTNPSGGSKEKPAATPPAADPTVTDPTVAEEGPATLLVLSDCRFEAVPDSSLRNLVPKFILMGSAESKNIAITSFAARRYEDQSRELEAVARLDNFSDQEAKFAAELSLDGRLIDSREVKIPPLGQQTVAFPLANIDSGALTLKIDPRDDLATDNSAYAVIQPPRRGRVLFVSPGSEGWEKALRTGEAGKVGDVIKQPPSYLLTDEYKRNADGGAWDLIIYDRCAPQKMPRANTFWIGRIPPDQRWKKGDRVEVPTIIDT
jgi:hypothetical protein